MINYQCELHRVELENVCRLNPVCFPLPFNVNGKQMNTSFLDITNGNKSNVQCQYVKLGGITICILCFDN